MTNKEAIEQLKWVKKRICDITYSPESFEAIDIAIKALEKEASREDRSAKRKPEKEKIEALAIEYQVLKEGELFRITSELNDKRIYRRDREGSTQISDMYGNSCNYKSYPYLTMKVYKLREADKQ